MDVIIIALATVFGATPIIVKLLDEKDELKTLPGRIDIGVLIVQDIYLVIVLALVGAGLEGAAGEILFDVARILGLMAAIGAVSYVAYQYLLPTLLASVASDRNVLFVGLAWAFLLIFVAEALELSVEVGAFAAGLAVASEYPHDVEMVDAVGYLEDFFTPIVFITLGALVSIPTVETLGIGALLLVAVFVLNPTATYLVLRWRGYASRTATLTGYNLDQVSEFALIIAIEALVAGILVPELFDAIVLAAIVTMLGSTVTERYAETGFQRLVERDVFESDIERVRRRSRVSDDLAAHVVVTGYDREGQQVVEACESVDQPYVVLESDPTREETVKDHCENYVLGDVMTTSTWTVANAEEAGLIVGTVARESWAEQILALDTDADIMVRAVDVESGADLLEQGALFVAIPDELAAERLEDRVEAVLTGEASREELRAQGEERLERAVEYGPSDVQRLR